MRGFSLGMLFNAMKADLPMTDLLFLVLFIAFLTDSLYLCSRKSLLADDLKLKTSIIHKH